MPSPASFSPLHPPPPWFLQGLQRRATPHPSELKSMKKGMEVRRSEASAAAGRDSTNSEVGSFCQHSGGLLREMPARPLVHGCLDLCTSLVSCRGVQRGQPPGLEISSSPCLALQWCKLGIW